MDKTKTQPGFIHRFIPPKNKKSKATIGTTDDEEGTQRETFTTFLLLHGTGGNEEDLIPLAYKLDKDAAILSPKGKVLEKKSIREWHYATILSQTSRRSL